MRSRGARVALIVLLVMAPVIVLGIAMALTSDGDDSENDALNALAERQARATAAPEALPSPPSLVTPSPTATPEGTPAATVTPTPEADPPAVSASRAPTAHAAALHIERLDVEAPLIAMNIDSNGVMEAPHAPELVAWYDFTSIPGRGTGNAVFAGHRDWRDHGPAVFWDLHELESGDHIEIALQDGTLLSYVVTGVHSYPVETLDMREILAPTTRESITLITCSGEFAAGDYTERHVVRAVRDGGA